MNEEKLKPISRWWLFTGVIAVAIAGLYSLPLAAARSPQVRENPVLQRLFQDALVVHVNLSVLVWFITIACLFWSLSTRNSRHFLPYLEEAALSCFGLGILFMIVSPLDPQAIAYRSNYIPTISSPVFLLSLSLLFCGVAFMLFKLFTSKLEGFSTSIRFGIISAGWITLIALSCFIWSHHLMPAIMEGEQYFELLFWGGGHVLQFTHTQMLMVVWLLLAAIIAPQKSLPHKVVIALFSVGLIATLTSPIAYLRYAVESFEFRQFFTHQMIALGGLAPALLSLWIIMLLWKNPAANRGQDRALYSTLYCSIALFLFGGILGLMIQGQNVVIPAHYHGSIVAITIAFMGFAYTLLPKFGYKPVTHTKLAYWQPITYTAGQLMHASALAYMGGYGVLRKTAGGTDELPLNLKIAAGFIGTGGLLAMIGGLMFVIVVVKSVYKQQN